MGRKMMLIGLLAAYITKVTQADSEEAITRLIVFLANDLEILK